MELATKIIYLGLLIICAGFFYFKGHHDGAGKAYENIKLFLIEYENAKKRVLKNDKK